jgi:hypothetical protein
MTSVLGPSRRPMIVVDSKELIRDRRSFSARAAGVLGMATFGARHHWALDAEMRFDVDALRAWLAANEGRPLLIFGFTFMVWQHLLQALEPGEVDLSQAVLVHSGGWKKLQEQAVGNAEFKAALRERLGIERVHNFYGMVEQIGTVFLECEEGVLHAPNAADVVVRDPATWHELPRGATGVAQVVSVLPTSYPGHSLLTEDLVEVVAEDDCPCGRRGRALLVHGRVPRAELRGCSDTHAAELRRAA